MVKREKFERLFSTPLFRFKVSDSATLNKQLLEQGERLRAESDGLNKSNMRGWHSSGNLFDIDEPCFRRLEQASTDAIFQATRKATQKVDPESLRMRLFAWMNISSPGSYNAPHTHPMAHWSGVYYVSQPAVEEGSSGKIEFLDPRTDLPNWRILGGPFFRPKRRFRPQAGEIVIFPSYLSHWVYPNETENERVTIAFNATFKKSPPQKING